MLSGPRQELTVIRAALGLLALQALSFPQLTFNPKPKAIRGPAMTASKDKVYLAGGVEHGLFVSKTVDDLQIYDETTGTWSFRTMPMAMSGASAAFVNGKLFVGAGHDKEGLRSRWIMIYDTSSATWSMETLVAPRSEATFVAVDHYLIVAGGRAGSGSALAGVPLTDVVEIYNTVTQTWTQTTLPVPVVLVTGEDTGLGTAVLAGGRDAAGNHLDEVQIIDPAQGTATILGHLSAPGYSISTGRLGSKLYFVGTGLESDIYDTYDVIAGTWNSDVMPVASTSLGGGQAVGDQMVLSPNGGWFKSSMIIYGATGHLQPIDWSSLGHYGTIAAATDTTAYFYGSYDSYFFYASFISYTPCAPVGASESVRLGNPPNPAALMPGVSQAPLVGHVWDPVIDHSTFMPTATLDYLAIAPASANVPSSLGTLLCGPTSTVLITSPGQPFEVQIPIDCVNVGLSLCAQGASLGAGGMQLTNALDIVIGAP